MQFQPPCFIYLFFFKVIQNLLLGSVVLVRLTVIVVVIIHHPNQEKVENTDYFLRLLMCYSHVQCGITQLAELASQACVLFHIVYFSS